MGLLHRFVLGLLFVFLLAGVGCKNNLDWATSNGATSTVDLVDRSTIEQSAWGAQHTADGPLVVYTDPGELPRLTLAGAHERLLPLTHTHVKANLSGFVADVQVTQTFGNPYGEPIEVVYIFPLPENSAVSAMRMKIGARTIRAKIEERGEARRTYARAKRRGHTTALLEQERPNIFTQSVANIAPGEKIDVVISYVQDLTYDDGKYEFVFPMVVGPRFIPGTPLDAAMRGTGTYLDTHRVPDSSRITPPVLGKGERSGHDISLELIADGTLPVADFTVPTHDVAVRRPADGTLRLTLAEQKSIPNRDFVLRYRVSGKEPVATLLTSGEQHDGYFALLVHPPELDVNELVGKRELIFVVDVSGSMSGVPLGMCKRAMRTAISKLRPVDTFNIITFAGATAKAFPSPRPANRSSIAQALNFLALARAGGGTHMDNAVHEALSPDVARGRHRYVFFLTDGFIGNEQEILRGSMELTEALEGRGQRARVFGYGVGSSVNRNLIEGISKAGNGVAVYATTREDPAEAVNTFFRYIDRPVLSDVRLSWGELGSSEMFPQPIPDLFASHPIIVHGRYRRLSDEPMYLHARIGEKRMRLPVHVRTSNSSGDKGGLIGQLWARSKVRFLEAESWVGMTPDAPARITQLGLNFGLVTAYTSFVAVDDSRVVGAGDPRQITQWVEVPEGVDGRAAGGRQHAPQTGLSRKSNVIQPELRSQQPMPSPAMSPMQPALEGEDADVDEEVGYASAPPSADRGPRGCGCHLVGNEQRARWPLAVLIALLSLAARRRRRR
jgi:Ca-activated chloride channel family protein